ncbi:gamma-glutamyltranspeptidase [Methylocella tundrae]|uniref:Glutathione hydrolase proenzyme n=1 Tax=Methylocella tundrae TaxID=227605 RepID=A0A8B6M4T6_METTU|nr:gamma-glutamyltransferase [Methylocella tundrae]VTZ24652.1 gamma-glutamyltranspeptidase [Methylocella tundrae]VTZ50021.1 gamma-glutamyltranspeptidase [Methylocella tundrae]
METKSSLKRTSGCAAWLSPGQRRFIATTFAALALIAASPTLADSTSPASTSPIVSQGARFLPVLAEHGMVAAQEGKAARIGVDILRRGGNAVDAAVAVGFALAVTLPRAGNLGGGGFMLVHLAESKKDIAIDYREAAPEATTRDVFLDATGAASPTKSRDTGLAVGVPGTVAGLTLAFHRYGSGKLSLADIVAPAVRLAREGIVVEDDLADSLQQTRRLARWPSSAKIFLHPDGLPLRRGETLAQPDLANVIEAIGADGESAFYTGEVAAKIIASVRAAGGRMTLDDLKSYRAIEREPVRGLYRGHEIISMPPPSSGGVHVIELLNILEGFPLADFGEGSAATIHVLAEAMKLAYADRAKYLGDPDQIAIPVRGLISKAYAARLRAEISLARARPESEITPLDPAPYESDQTTHFSVVDAEGNAVANTYTLNFSYGLGLVAEGAGVLLNNELDDFAAKPGAPNAFGLLGGEANAPAPRRRPLSSMAPTMLFRDGELELVTGSPGGSRIITIVTEIISDVVDFKMNIAEATAAPRIHHQGVPDELEVERGVSIDTIRLLEALGQNVATRGAWGSAESILRAKGLLMGAADPRQRGTLAVGY